MVAVSNLLESVMYIGLSVCTHIHIYILPAYFVTSKVYLFSLYISFGLCLSCYRLSSVGDLGSLLILKSGTLKRLRL